MSYNLYQAQQAAAWTERIVKEQQIAERFAVENLRREKELAKKKASGGSALDKLVATGSQAPSQAGSRRSVSTSVMKDKLALLEAQLLEERAERRKVEAKLERLVEVAGVELDMEEAEEGEQEAQPTAQPEA